LRVCDDLGDRGMKTTDLGTVCWSFGGVEEGGAPVGLGTVTPSVLHVVSIEHTRKKTAEGGSSYGLKFLRAGRTLFPLSGADMFWTTRTRGCTHMFRSQGCRWEAICRGCRVGRRTWHWWRSGVVRRVVGRILWLREVRCGDVRVRGESSGRCAGRITRCWRIVGAARRMSW
jgi:hypothetical protein